MSNTLRSLSFARRRRNVTLSLSKGEMSWFDKLTMTR